MSQLCVCCRSPHGSVDWNTKVLGELERLNGRSPHGSVDWNYGYVDNAERTMKVAPHTGAWIEIMLWYARKSLNYWSLPTRERGLKFSLNLLDFKILKSLPTRERGLKSIKSFAIISPILVAPHTGAWIEIDTTDMKELAQIGRSPHGSVDWNIHASLSPLQPLASRSPHGSVDWNIIIFYF